MISMTVHWSVNNKRDVNKFMKQTFAVHLLINWLQQAFAKIKHF
jgi:hypothetical protein